MPVEKNAKDIFDSYGQLKDKSNALVLFYATWCHYCTVFKKDVWNSELDRAIPMVKLYSVEASTDSDFINNVLSRQGKPLRGYPTVFHFKNGKIVGSEVDRSKSGLVRAAMQ
mgnify:CR=1 FL=1